MGRSGVVGNVDSIAIRSSNLWTNGRNRQTPAWRRRSERSCSARGRPGCAVRHGTFNSRIVARDRSDSRWWERNRDVVKYLDQGLSVREISILVSHGERQVRIIRERLHDLRTNNSEGEALAAVA